MTMISKPFNPDLTPAYGGCRCDCPHIEGVHHIVACCHPGDRDEFAASILAQQEPTSKSEEDAS